MLFKTNRVSIFLAAAFFVLTVQGCDKLSHLGDYFSSKPKATKKSAAVLQETAVAAPTSPSSPTENPASLETKISAKVVAKVGHWTLTDEQFREKLNMLKEAVPEYDIKNVEQNKMVLGELIRQQLLVEKALQLGLDKDKNFVMAMEEFKNTLLVQQIAKKITESVTPATEQEAEDFYNKNKNEFMSEGQWKVREIVVDSEPAAKDILATLSAGADFGETAKAKSKGKTAAQGGDLGTLTAFPFVQMRDAVAGMKAGEVTGVVQGPDGFYIFKLEEKKGGEVKPFAEIKDQIKEGVTVLKQQQAIMDYLEKLQKEIPVEKNEKLLEE